MVVLGPEEDHAHLEVVVEDDPAVVEVDLPTAVTHDVVGVQLLLEGADRVAIHVRLQTHVFQQAGRER